MKLITAEEVVQLIPNNAVVIMGGFGCCGHPDILTEAISNLFIQENRPAELTLLFASGAGDKKGLGLDRLTHEGLVKIAIGGFWGFCPKLVELGKKGIIEAHSWPLGVISHLFRDMSSGLEGHLTTIGLNTFVDPRIEGGIISKNITPLVELVYFRNKEMLFYPSVKCDFALLRGTVADLKGNISMEGEAALHDALWQAMAARNNGGKVVVQVERVIEYLPPDKVDIPSHLIDFIVQSNSTHYPSYGFESNNRNTSIYHELTLAKELIIEKACSEIIPSGAYLNFGIGIPALIGKKLSESNKNFHSSIESGVINGKPKEGLCFGEAIDYSCIMQQTDLFSFYNGGGIDIAFLGFAEIDSFGNINSSAFASKITGAGGFINIAHSAKEIILCGTSTTSELVLLKNKKGIIVQQEGKISKFVYRVQQITVSTNQPLFYNKKIKIITERCVLNLHKGVFTLIEIINGFKLDDIINVIPFDINIPSHLEYSKDILNEC